ncbi:hypothetical protein EB796_007524 [Bugula neritina]|uniref:BACK domain-containing protein n=1 Tax=Bugula neritina TaxID=10212 RepID=A0A7J7K987_BUGNE|nr:hypothetical protein EB796_007524 [Bugula neritina]
MELHHIGNFLELPALIEKCEDFIVQSINTENLSTVLCWSLEASGSRWVYREALQYIQDNFRQISQSSALYSLDEPTLTKVLQSDFLQASELDVLQAVINWSEHQLIKKLESQEPNLVTHTAHSLARKGIKAKDLDDSQIREIASPLMLHVRQSHILSNNSTVVANAVKRGLVGTNTPRDITASEPILNIHSTYGQRGSWVPPTKTSVRRYEVPRAYMPFYDLAKALLEERTKDMSESDVVHLRRPGRANPTLNTLSRSRVLRHTTFNPREVEEVIDKTEHLLQSPLVVQALQACWDKSAVLKQVCLWAVRELSYPDQIIYTVNSRATPPTSSDDTNPHLLTSSLVPDLAPEKLILQHGLSSSYENLTIHSVSSSPDVTLLSVRSYRHPVGGVGAAAAPFPDVTLHSHSSSDESSSPGASARPRGLLVSSLSKVKKYATNTAPPSARSKDSTRQACREKVDCKLQPDILGDASLSDSVSSRRLSPTHTSIRHASTLDSKPRRYRRRSQTVNPYHTPPRGSCNQSTSNLLYSSLTRNISVEYDRLLAQEGPPPDIAPQPSRRLTRTSTPPDITSSPSNTWQAML